MAINPTSPKLTLTWGNDFFNPFAVAKLDGRRFDDDGFTNDLAATYAQALGATTFELAVQHRMITERGGLRRTDQIDFGADLTRRFSLDGAQVVLGGGVAGALSGPFGGAYVQDKFHHLVKGRHLDGTGSGQLQNQEPASVRAGVLLSATASVSHAFAGITLGSVTRAALALGATGLSSVMTEVYAQGALRLSENAAFDVRLSVSANLLHTRDPSLVIRGGYNTDRVFVSPRVGVGVTVRDVRAGWDIRLNEGGSGVNLGILSLGFAL